MSTISEPVRLLRVAVTGPESTGKTTLCEALARHFQTTWAPEFAREYLNRHGAEYNESDLERIAQGQIANITQQSKKADKLFFCDTEMLVMKIWFEHKFRKTNDFIEQHYLSQHFDLYLLCGTDIEWEFDPLREHPEMRDYFFTKYKTELEKKDVRFLELHGNHSTRLQASIEAILKLK